MGPSEIVPVQEHFCTNIKLFEVEKKGSNLEVYIPCLDCRLLGPPVLTIGLNKPVVVHCLEQVACKACGFKIANDNPESRLDVLNRAIIPVTQTEDGAEAKAIRSLLERILERYPEDTEQKPSVDDQRQVQKDVYALITYVFDLCGVWLPDLQALRNFQGEVDTFRIEVAGLASSGKPKGVRRIQTNISLKLRGDETNIWYNEAYVKDIPGWSTVRETPYLAWQAPFEGGFRLTNVSGVNLRPYKGAVQTTFLSNHSHSKTYQAAVRQLVSHTSVEEGGSSCAIAWDR